MMWKLYLGIVPIVLSIIGCATYEAREVPIKTVSEYQNISTISEVTIAVDSYDNPSKAESAFYVDTTKKNIRPILIVIDNKSSDNYLINRSEILLKDRSGAELEPVTSDYAFDQFEINEFLHSALFGIFGELAAEEANEKMKSDWNEKELHEEFIANSNSSDSGFVFFETEDPIHGNVVILNALDLRTNEVLNFELEIM